MTPELVSAIAALATSASAIVIAWQAVLTRSSVKVSRNALILSERSYRSDLITTIESRSRVPAIEVGKLVRTLAIIGVRGAETIATESDVFRFPRDENRFAVVRLDLRILNEGDRPMTIQAKWPARFETPPGAETPWVKVLAGEEMSLVLALRKSLLELRDVGGTPELLERPGTFVGTIEYDGPLNADMSLYHHVYIMVPPLVENTEMTGDWGFAETPDVHSMISLGGARTYWESRSEGVKLREDKGVAADVALSAFMAEHASPTQ